MNMVPKCRTCGDPLITEVPATGDGQCVDCWLLETKEPEDDGQPDEAQEWSDYDKDC